MGPYYDHASLQMRVFARVSGQQRSVPFSVRSMGGTAPRSADDNEESTTVDVGAWAAPGVALAIWVAALLSGLGASDHWTMLSWRPLISASIGVLAAMVFPFWLFIAG